MSLLKFIAEGKSPYEPRDSWTVGVLGAQGAILSVDGFSLKLDGDQLEALYQLVETGQVGEVRDHLGKIVLVEPTQSGVILTRSHDTIYPNGVLLDLDALKELGIEEYEEEVSDEDGEVGDAEDLEEGLKRAYRRSGNKIKRGFRVTSGRRKGRVVANIRTAFAPRAKASTRLKLKLAARKKKIIRVLKARRTRKKSVSKRLRRLNDR